MYQPDELDLKILELLLKDGKMSNKEIASQIGLSITPTFERIKKLEREKIIKSYTVKLDKSRIGKGLRVLCQISLKEHNENAIQLFEHEVKGLNEIQECLHVAGNIDYLLSVEVSNMEAYQTFLKQKLARLSNISNVQSSFVMGVIM